MGENPKTYINVYPGNVAWALVCLGVIRGLACGVWGIHGHHSAAGGV